MKLQSFVFMVGMLCVNVVKSFSYVVVSNVDVDTNTSSLENYYDFALSWNPQEDTQTNYTIHGLWPQYNESMYPSYCDGVHNNTFDVVKIEDLIPTMEKVWMSMEESNDLFWSHEWNKHGTCNWNGWNIHQYFYNTVLTYKYYLEDFEKLCYEDGKDCIIMLDQNLRLLK